MPLASVGGVGLVDLLNHDDVISLQDLRTQQVPIPLISSVQTIGKRSTSVLALADVRLVDDAYGGVWACTRSRGYGNVTRIGIENGTETGLGPGPSQMPVSYTHLTLPTICSV